MYVLNYSHPLSDVAVRQLEARYGDLTIIDIPTQVDFDQPISPQVDKLVAAGKPYTYQMHVVVPPGMGWLAALVVAGLCGLVPIIPPAVVIGRKSVFEPYEVLDVL